MRSSVVALSVVAAVIGGTTSAAAAAGWIGGPGGSDPKGAAYYLDPSGNDSSPGTVGSPWRTMAGAQSNVRGLISLTARAPITVNVAPGSYGPLTFGTADSGLAWPVTWKSTTLLGAQALGGTAITGWTLYSGSIYRVAITPGTHVTTMWENGVRAREARFPAFVADATYQSAQTPYLLTTGVTGSQTILQYGVGDLSPSGWDLNSVRVAIWSGGLGASGGSRAWWEDRVTVSAINTGTRQITLGAAANYPVYDNAFGARYYVEGDLSFLVGAGQFYCDAANGWLYYWPLNTPIASQTIMLPTVDNVVTFAGTSLAAPVKNIVLDGWEIAYSNSSNNYQQSDFSTRDKALVYMHNALMVGVRNSKIHGAGMTGVEMIGAARLCQLTSDEIYDTASNAVLLDNYPGVPGVYPAEAPDLGDVNGQNTIANCKIHDVGQLFGRSAIYVFASGSNQISHCEIYNSPRSAVEMRGGVGTDASHMYAKYNLTEYLYAHHVMQDSGDCGAFDVGETNDTVNTWNQLLMDHVGANAASMTDIQGAAMYTDNNAANQVLSNINASTVQGDAYKSNAGASSQTNCYWGVGFNAALMSTSIGTVGFPW